MYTAQGALLCPPAAREDSKAPIETREKFYYDNVVTIYEHCDFQGRSQTLAPGRYDMSQLTFGNDVLSSVRVPAGMLVRLYQHAGFGGKTLDLTSDASCLTAYTTGEGPKRRPTTWNDYISSIEVFSRLT